MKLYMVAVSDLHISPVNVRPYDPDADKELPPIVASARSIGIIQPIVIRARKGKAKGFEIIAGRRRWEAAKRAELVEIPALEIDHDADATQISLAENYARKQMRLPEIYQAFAKIQAERPNATVEEIGAMFGYDVARTRRIMRLSNLSPTVMAAYQAGALDDAQAIAFAATEDHGLQDHAFAAFNEQPAHAKHGRTIHRLLGIIGQDEANLLRYVGRDLYESSGGRFEEDLFNEGQGILRDGAILQRLYLEQLETDKDRYIYRLARGKKCLSRDGELTTIDIGFSWTDEPPQITQHGYTQKDWELRLKPALSKLSEEDAARSAELDVAIDSLGDQLEEEKPDDDDKRWDELEEMEVERAAIEAGRMVELPAKKGNVVGIATVEKGEFVVDLWYASRKDAGIAPPAGSKTAGAKGAEQSDGEKMRRRLGITKDGAHAMFLLRREMIRENLFLCADRGSDIALDFLIYSQARTILRQEGVDWEGKPVIKGEPQGIETPASQDSSGMKPPKKVREVFARLKAAPNYHDAIAKLRDADWCQHHDPVVGFDLYRAVDIDTKNRAIGIVACFGLMASTSFYNDGETPRMLEDLANRLTPEEGANEWRETFTMDTAFFELFNQKSRRQMLESFGAADHPDGFKAVTSSTLLAKIMSEDAEVKFGLNHEDGGYNATWIPEILETNQVKPMAEPNAEPTKRQAAAAALSRALDGDCDDDLDDGEDADEALGDDGEED